MESQTNTDKPIIKKWSCFNPARIINNLTLIFKTNDITKLKKSTYKFLNLMSGFIAHYNLYGFQDYYKDLRDLIRDLKESSDVQEINNIHYYLNINMISGDQKDYYRSEYDILIQIKPLIEKYESEINAFFSLQEKDEDISTIKALMLKNKLKEVIV